MKEVLRKKIVFFGNDCYICCDGNCSKAFGLVSRPQVVVGDKRYWVSDNEFESAPEDPGTYEGCDGKPVIITSEDMNRWCARACERSCILSIDEETNDRLPNWDDRIEVEAL